MNCWDIVNKYISSGVTKYIHRNGMETAIKTIPTCGVDKNKAVLFISSSVGCEQKCPICHITTNDFKFSPIDDKTVIMACKVAIDDFDISDKYLKISFMGMGDLFATDLNCYEICRKVFRYALAHERCLGIDGVDIATSIPRNYNSSHFKRIEQLEEYLRVFCNDGEFSNPNNNYHYERSFVRIFISLHSIFDKTRMILMPKSIKFSQMHSFARMFHGKNSIIFHITFVKGINDSFEEVYQLMKFAEWIGPDYEFRFLRFNRSNNSKLEESDRVDEIIDLFKSNNEVNFKYQISAGSEISASCGQFICGK